MQLISGAILGAFSFRAIYFLSFVVMLIFFFMAVIGLRGMPDPKYDKMGILKYIGKFLKNKNLFRAYGLSILLHLFYAWMVIYTPIYLSAHLDFSWWEICVIFAVMLLPFLIIPFPLGKYADKLGERKMLMAGFLIASLSTLLLFFMEEQRVLMWAVLLFITRVGAASIEVMSDAYFFKHIKPENEEMVGVYRTASPLAYILGPMVAFVVFMLVPSFNFIYPVLAVIMLYGAYLASTIRKSDI